MNWTEFNLARLFLSEERVGKYVRTEQREELAQDEATKELLRARGLVS